MSPSRLRNTFILLLVRQAGLGHLPGEPFPTVESHVHCKWEPTLHPCVSQTVFGIQVVVVIMKTFTRLHPHLKLPGLLVATHLYDPAGLDAAQHRDQSVLAPMLGCQAQRHLLLALLAVVQKSVETASLASVSMALHNATVVFSA